MVRLAVASRAETCERIRGPLGDRGIDVGAILARERTFVLDDGSTVDGVSPPDRSAVDLDAFDVGYVFPGRLVEGGVVDALLSVPWVNDREAVLRSRNKAETIARLQAAGVPVPETVLVSNPVDDKTALAVFERFDDPVVVKPTTATRGKGVVRVDDPDSFRGVVDYLDVIHEDRTTRDRSYLVQEYLSEATDYRAMVLDGEFVGAVRRSMPDDEQTEGRWKHNVHRGADAEGVDLPAELRRLAERAAAAMDVRLLGVDLLVTDGRAVVVETNARPTIDDAEKYEDDFYDRFARLIRKTAV
ncbi:MAG: RimK family alpha-L-glutamate ligase [Halanaeroarchaeum sp.]